MSENVTNDLSGIDIADTGDFRDALRELLVNSHENDTDVTGGWRISPDDDSSVAWDVEITRLAPETTHQIPQSEEFPVDAILTAVASHEGVEKTELPPLQDSIDVESLERVFTDLADGEPGEMTFHYCDCLVTVHGDGQITVSG